MPCSSTWTVRSRSSDSDARGVVTFNVASDAVSDATSVATGRTLAMAFSALAGCSSSAAAALDCAKPTAASMATEEPVAKTEEPKTEEKVRAEPARLSLAGRPLPRRCRGCGAASGAGAAKRPADRHARADRQRQAVGTSAQLAPMPPGPTRLAARPVIPRWPPQRSAHAQP